MNTNIKKMCLELAEKALEVDNLEVDISTRGIAIWHLKDNWDELGETENKYIYNKSIYFGIYTDKGLEERLQKALDYVKNLGGNDDE